MAAPEPLLPIAIIGAGFSGTMLAIHLCRALPSERPVFLCDRSGQFARGLAYATTHSDHLLNVRATNMSAYPEVPDHFAKWLERCGPEDEIDIRHTAAGTFAARGLYGRYLTELLGNAVIAPGGALHLTLAKEAVTDLEPFEHGFWMTLLSGRKVEIAGAILACGNLAAAGRLASRFLADTWATTPLDDLPSDKPILVVGSGLTMIDAISAIRTRGFRGPIVAISRRGLLPRSHAPTAPWPKPAFTPEERHSTSLLLRRIRSEVAAALAAGIGWHSVIDSLRPQSIAIWRGLPLDAQRRFLRHLRAYWDVHRHRTAPPAAEAIATELKAGTLRILRAKIGSIEDLDDSARVTFRERGANVSRSIEVGRIVDASGIASVADTDDPLLRRLLDRGQIRPDPLRLGLDVADDYAILDRDGSHDSRLWTLGPLLRGTLWECTAVPDIRTQAADLARIVAGRLHGNASFPMFQSSHML